MTPKVKANSKARPQTLSAFRLMAAKRLSKVLEVVRAQPTLLSKGARGDVELEILSAPRMRAINRDFRGKDKATDVLSFPAPAFYRKSRVSPRMGELLICLPVLRKQAAEVGHSEAVELDVLLVHGILHLLGFDHELGGAEARAMAKWEGKLLAALGRKVGLIERQSAS